MDFTELSGADRALNLARGGSRPLQRMPFGL